MEPKAGSAERIGIAETINDIYSSLLETTLEGTFEGRAVLQHDGIFTFPAYVRQGENIVPGHGRLCFAYAHPGLTVEMLVGEAVCYSGSILIDDDAVVELLTSPSLSVVQRRVGRTTDISLCQINGLPVQGLSVQRTATEARDDELPYFGMQLPERIIKRIRQRLGEQPKPSPAQTMTLDEQLGWYVIDPQHNDARQRTAALLANWERQGIYKGRRWIFAEGKEYGLQEIIPDYDAAGIIGERQHMLRQRREEACAVIPAVECVRTDYHPLVLVYLLNTPTGRGPFVKDEAIRKSLYLDDAGMEYARNNLLEKKGAGILRTSVHELQLEWYRDAWDILTEQRDDAAGRAVKDGLQQNYNHHFLAGKTFRSVAQRQADGSYTLPVIVAGKMLPLGIEAHLIIGDELRVFSAAGIIGKRSREGLVIPHTNKIVVTYQSLPDTQGITIEEIVRWGDAMQAAAGAAPEEVPECSNLRSGSRGLETSPPAGIQSQKIPERRPRDALLRDDILQGASRIGVAIGLDGGQFSQQRDVLRRAGLLYQDEPGSPWQMRQGDVPAARRLLGVEQAVISLPDQQAEPPAGLSDTKKINTEEIPQRSTPGYDQASTSYDPLRHVPLGVLVDEIVAFSKTDREIHRYVFGRSAGNFPKIRQQYFSGGRILNFLDREDVGDLVRMFQPNPDLDLSDETVAGIRKFYAARAIPNSDLPQGTLRLDFAIRERGIEKRSAPFFRARHYLAQTLGERLVLIDGIYPAVMCNDRDLVETLLDAYSAIDKPPAGALPASALDAPSQRSHPSRSQHSEAVLSATPSLERRVSDAPTHNTPQKTDTGTKGDNHIYLCWAESLVPNHVGPGAGKGRFFRAMKTNYGADDIPAGGALFEHTIGLARLYQKHNGEHLSLEDAVRTLQAELQIEDIAALEIVERESSFKGDKGKIRRERVLGYALRQRFMKEHPEFAETS